MGIHDHKTQQQLQAERLDRQIRELEQLRNELDPSYITPSHYTVHSTKFSRLMDRWEDVTITAFVYCVIGALGLFGAVIVWAFVKRLFL